MLLVVMAVAATVAAVVVAAGVVKLTETCEPTEREASQAPHHERLAKVFCQVVFKTAVNLIAAERRREQGLECEL